MAGCKLVAYLILSTSIGCAHIVPGIAPNAPTHPCCKHLMGSIVVIGGVPPVCRSLTRGAVTWFFPDERDCETARLRLSELR